MDQGFLSISVSVLGQLCLELHPPYHHLWHDSRNFRSSDDQVIILEDLCHEVVVFAKLFQHVSLAIWAHTYFVVKEARSVQLAQNYFIQCVSGHHRIA